jgi:hypothetical protein
MSENGTMISKQSPLSLQKMEHELDTGPLCHLFPKKYFDTHMRLGDECLPKTSDRMMALEDGCELAQLKVQPIVVSQTCSNPVEYFVFVAILIAMVRSENHNWLNNYNFLFFYFRNIKKKLNKP